MIERQIDFYRSRIMCCGQCDHKFDVDWNWLDRWNHAKEQCSRCGTTCESEERARPYLNKEDPVLHDDTLLGVYWYHTTESSEWPDPNFDPLEKLTEQTIMRMGGMNRAEHWARYQRNKALHLGTYEAAIHNMLRRIQNQNDEGKNFHIYRVQLNSNSMIRPCWYDEFTNLVGDADVDEACPRPYSIARYLNVHEDPGSLSLAIRPEAIATTQSIQLSELKVNQHELDEIISRLEDAYHKPLLPEEYVGKIKVDTNRSPVLAEANAIVAEISKTLPLPFKDALHYPLTDDPLQYESFARWVLAVQLTVTNSAKVLQALDSKKFTELLK